MLIKLDAERFNLLNNVTVTVNSRDEIIFKDYKDGIIRNDLEYLFECLKTIIIERNYEN